MRTAPVRAFQPLLGQRVVPIFFVARNGPVDSRPADSSFARSIHYPVVQGSRKFHLRAWVSTDAYAAVRPILLRYVEGRGSFRETEEWFILEADVDGPSARELNDRLLRELRHVEKRTRLRAEWTREGVTERFFGAVSRSGTTRPPSR